MKTAFDQEVAQHYDRWYETEAGRYISSLEERLIGELLGETKGLHILDLGCGTGRHLKLLESMGSDAVGIPTAMGLGVYRGRIPPKGATVPTLGSEQVSSIMRFLSVARFG